jgi:NADH dehydrogenase
LARYRRAAAAQASPGPAILEQRSLEDLRMNGGSILVLGGTGFVGRHVVQRLVADGYDVVVPTRRSDKARFLQVLPTVNIVPADLNRADALTRLVASAAAVVNLVGILNETRGTTFGKAHVDLAGAVTTACRSAGVRRLVHMSAQNASPDGPSRYLRTKGEAEAIVAASGLDWTIFRPSVIFGREDRFLNLFATLLRYVPVIALANPDARFQPVHVGDVAHCLVDALPRPSTYGRVYPLCGPNVYSLRELVRYAGAVTGKTRPIIGLGPTLSRIQASVLQHLPGSLLTPDNLASMQKDSTCDGESVSAFGIVPQALENMVPSYLGPDAIRDRYSTLRVRGAR